MSASSLLVTDSRARCRDSSISASFNSASASLACCAKISFHSKSRFSVACPMARSKPKSFSAKQSCRKSAGMSISPQNFDRPPPAARRISATSTTTYNTLVLRPLKFKSGNPRARAIVTLIIPKKIADGLAEEDRLRTFDQSNLHPALEKGRRVSIHSPPDDLAGKPKSAVLYAEKTVSGQIE